MCFAILLRSNEIVRVSDFFGANMCIKLFLFLTIFFVFSVLCQLHQLHIHDNRNTFQVRGNM